MTLASTPISQQGVEVRPHERFSPPYRFPYHLGLYLATNAIPGAYAVIDGPDCLYRKAEWVHGRHDLASTLLDAGGRHRVVPTLLHSAEVIRSEGSELLRRLRRVAMLHDAELMLVNTMPHVQIIGTQYDRLIAEVNAESGLPILEVPSRALDGDWLGAYGEVLSTLARKLPLAASPRPGTVAFIGLVYERNEGDGRGNVRALEEIATALELEPVSVWLSGRGVDHLAAAAEAEFLVALPHGVPAAHALAARTGAKVLELPLPFGLHATTQLVRGLARATDRAAAGERFLQREMRRVLPPFEWLVPSLLRGKKIAFSGDPTLFPGLLRGMRELGMDVLHLSAPARKPDHGTRLDPAEHGALPPVAYAPPTASLDRELAPILADVDLLVANSQLQGEGRSGRVEFGFPCFHRHALSERGWLGIDGWAFFVELLANRMLAA